MTSATNTKDAAVKQVRKEVKAALREHTRFLLAHIDHMDAVDLLSVRDMVVRMGEIHGDDQCFIDREREGL
jgi:hypothetical protein